VLRFSIGFGRPILSWRRGETEYWLSWLPLGGYVKMAGLEDEGVAGGIEGGKSDVPVDPARAFDRQPVWKRTIVILAGVTMNAVVAFFIYFGLAGSAGDPGRLAAGRPAGAGQRRYAAVLERGAARGVEQPRQAGAVRGAARRTDRAGDRGPREQGRDGQRVPATARVRRHRRRTQS